MFKFKRYVIYFDVIYLGLSCLYQDKDKDVGI